MNIQMNWKTLLVVVLGGALATAIYQHETVANTFAAQFANILTALGAF